MVASRWFLRRPSQAEGCHAACPVEPHVAGLAARDQREAPPDKPGQAGGIGQQQGSAWVETSACRDQREVPPDKPGQAGGILG